MEIEVRGTKFKPQVPQKLNVLISKKKYLANKWVVLGTHRPQPL